ncbi:MAG: response regulator transcription factor [Deltaproteobacteria bacterium]|nr:response regulator transcription factor [Deltaproteobacteria bacterium]
MSIKVAVALSNALFSEGIKKLLDGSDEIRVTEIVRPGASPARANESSRPDVLVLDFATLYGTFGEEAPPQQMKLVLIDTGCGDENIISAVISKGVKGVVSASSAPSALKKAIRAAASGEVWLDKLDIKSLLAGLHTIRKRKRPALSDREWEVVSLVGQGLRNREIAEKLCISEPTVKTHLQRIFHKLDIRNRPQLITFAIRYSNELPEAGAAG